MANPNKCDLCGLKLRMEDDPAKGSKITEKEWGELRVLQDKKLVPKGWPRNIYTGNVGPGYWDFCAINSPAWNKTDRSCKHFHLKNEEMKISEYLSIYTANKTAKTTKALMWTAIIISALIFSSNLVFYFLK